MMPTLRLRLLCAGLALAYAAASASLRAQDAFPPGMDDDPQVAPLGVDADPDTGDDPDQPDAPGLFLAPEEDDDDPRDDDPRDDDPRQQTDAEDIDPTPGFPAPGAQNQDAMPPERAPQAPDQAPDQPPDQPHFRYFAPPFSVAGEGAEAVFAAEGNGTILLNFRQAPLDTVLDHLSHAAGFAVLKEAPTDSLVDVWSHRALTVDEAVDLLNTVLNAKGLAAVRTERTLRIVPQQSAAIYDLPVHTGADPEEIPRSDAMVTQVIPVRHADAAKMLDNLKPLLAPYASMSANQNSNAIIITDTQTRIRRIVSVIQALDTSISSVTEIRVFPLQNSDSEELAKLVNSVFEAPAEQRQTNQRDRMRQMFTRMRGGGDEGGNGAAEGGRTASMSVKAVADPHSNSVVVNAPGDLMDDIGRLIQQVDIAAEELLQLRVFPCRYADAQSVAQSIAELFGTSATAASQANRRITRFGPAAARGAQPGATDSSGRRVKEAEVKATADLRTNSVMVTASAKTMALVEIMISELDSSPKNVSQVYIYRIQHADLEALQQTMQNMFDDIEDSTGGSTTTRRASGTGTTGTRTTGTTTRRTQGTTGTRTTQRR